MKKQKNQCDHMWEDLCEYRTEDGTKWLKQKCTNCKVQRDIILYSPSQKNNEVTKNGEL